MIAGELAGAVHRGPGSTYTPITMVHATLQPGARLHLPWRADFNALAYVLSGSGTFGRVGEGSEAARAHGASSRSSGRATR